MHEAEQPVGAVLTRETVPSWDLIAPRFPVVRRGYDRDTVDEYIASLEQEVEDLRAGHEASGAVAAEIERIGEQTVAILRVAHEQAERTTRQAREEADRCLSAAAANAVAMTEDARRQVTQLDSETEAIWHERTRLLEDVRRLATALTAVADDGLERFPPEPERVLSETPTAPVGPVGEGYEGTSEEQTSEFQTDNEY
jgi:uncharacterized protein YoxC